MALEVVEKIKNAEQRSLNLESEALLTAQQYIKSSTETDSAKASKKIALQNQERKREIEAARQKAEQIIAEAQKTAQAEADALIKTVEAKKREVINTIIEKILK